MSYALGWGLELLLPKQVALVNRLSSSYEPISLSAGGTNIRELLVDNGINVYRSITRWTNCKGKQRCGTCIVDVSLLISAFQLSSH